MHVIVFVYTRSIRSDLIIFLIVPTLLGISSIVCCKCHLFLFPDATHQCTGEIIILAPALNVLRKIVRDLMKVKPEIAYQISTVKELIYSSLLDLGEFTRVTIEYYVATSYEAKEILEEAKKIAEQKLEEI